MNNDNDRNSDFSFLDSYIRRIMEESLEQIAPSAQISQKYLANLGMYECMYEYMYECMYECLNE